MREPCQSIAAELAFETARKQKEEVLDCHLGARPNIRSSRAPFSQEEGQTIP
jgi:hypothetical protein